MSHLRKTKKRTHGGAETVFICQKGRTGNRECIADFSQALHFRFTNVAPDGNCFFHTLQLYYRNRGNVGVDKSYTELRARIVNHILENWDEYSEFGIEQEDILDLTGDGEWNNNAGDLVVPAAARVLGVQIHLYDLKPAVRGKFAAPKQVIKHIYPDPLPMPAPAQTINILRINQGHFGLLTPVAAAAAAPAGAGGPGRAPTPPQAAPPPRAATPPRSVTPPAARRKPVVAPNSRATAKNVVGNTAKALANMRLANKAAPATGPATRSRTRATAKRNVSRSPASNSSFEKEMRRAIEASKRVNMIAKGAENAAKKAEIVAKKAEADAKKEAARAKIAAKRAANAVKKAAKKAANNAQRQEAENLQEAIAASLKNMPSSFL